MQKAGILHIQRGFTLVEMMVTIAVLVILASLAVPGLQAFTTRSGMNAIRDDFSIALQRARLDAISRNTCVSICQLAEGKTDACATTGLGKWHSGWVVYANPDCSGAVPVAALDNAAVIAVRQPGDARFELNFVGEDATPPGIVTFDPRGTVLGTPFTVRVTDARDKDSALSREIAINRQGRVAVRPASSDSGGGTVQ